MSHRLSWSGVASAVAVAAVLLLAAPVSRAGPAPTPSPSPSLAVPLAPLPASLAEAARQGPSGGYANGLIFPGLAVALGTPPSSGQCLEYDGTQITGAACSGGSGGSPGGSTTDVQYNAGGGSFGGSANLTWVSPTLTIGVDNSVAGLLVLSSSGASAHNVLASGATTTNTVKFFATAPTTGDLVSCTTSSTTCTLTDAAILAANVVTAASNFTSGDLIQAAGNNKTTSDSNIIAANVLTDASNLGSAGILYATGNKTAAATTNATLDGSGNAVFAGTLSADGIAYLTSLTSGGVLCGTSSSQVASSGALTSTALVVGGGAGACPSVGNGDFTYATHTLSSAAAGLVDLSAITSTAGFKVPVHATNTASAAGALVFDSTNKNFHGYVNGADSLFLNIASAPTTGHLLDSAVSSGNTLAHDSGIATSTVVTSASSLTSTALVTGAGSQGLQTPSATSTLDSSGNMILAGSLTVTPAAGVAGLMAIAGNTSNPSYPTNSFGFLGPNSASFTSWFVQPTATAPSSACLPHYAAVASQVVAETCSTVSLTADVSNILPVAYGGSGAGTLTGPIKGNGTSAFTAASSSDIIGLWTGSCSGSTWLAGDGSCSVPGGGGNVSNSGTSPASPAQYYVPIWNTSTTLGGLQCAAGTTLLGSATYPSCSAALVLGVDNSTAGTLQLANGSSAHHTILGSVATTTNTVDFFAAVPTNGDMFYCAVSSTTCTLTDAGFLYSNVITDSSNLGAAGIVYQTGNKTVAASTNATLDSSGNMVAARLLASGIVDGEAPVTVTTVTSCTLGTASGCNSTAYDSGYTFNQYATAATGVAYTLPTAAAGKQYCVRNSYNGSAANTGVLTVNTSASGQFLIDVDGTLGSTGGHITSGGAGGDAACFVGVDTTHWQVYVQKGTWTKN